VAITVDSATSGFLVLSDLFYPGWKAFVGEREVPIYRANYLFRAVWLPQGRHSVRFEYHPASFRYGLIVSAGTALVVLAVVCARRRLQGRRALAVPASTGNNGGELLAEHPSCR